MKGNGCASPRRAPPTKGPRRSNLVYPIMAIAHEGLASLAVDLHEVGDLLALTNSLVQLHNLVGGSQVTPSQSRRHHSPRSNKWCVDDELLALVLQMIVSPTLNSLSQDLDLVERIFEWKATWEGQRSRFIWQEWNILTSTQVQVVLSQKMQIGSVGSNGWLSP